MDIDIKQIRFRVESAILTLLIFMLSGGIFFSIYWATVGLQITPYRAEAIEASGITATPVKTFENMQELTNERWYIPDEQVLLTPGDFEVSFRTKNDTYLVGETVLIDGWFHLENRRNTIGDFTVRQECGNWRSQPVGEFLNLPSGDFETPTLVSDFPLGFTVVPINQETLLTDPPVACRLVSEATYSIDVLFGLSKKVRVNYTTNDFFVVPE